MGYGFYYQLIMTEINKDRLLLAAKELFSVWKNTPKFWRLVVFCIIFNADCVKNGNVFAFMTYKQKVQ